jgi:predicted Kef-type K+ transport protein
METIAIVVAFTFGFLVKQVGLPPLVGFLAAGFFLKYMGLEGSETLYTLADVGIILLLFSIGLKVQVQKLFVKQIWATASIHMLVITSTFGLLVFLLSVGGLSYFINLDLGSSLALGFALSFSSTVFAVKILEEQGEMNSRHGKLAIGILIIQDLFAVLFITISAGKIPSPWALSLFGLYFLRWPLMLIMDRSGHGELVVLLACILPIAGASVFEYVGLKPDLGALVLGMALAGHPKTEELAKAMFGFKDLFLVGFFLTIGLSGLPNVEMLKIAGLLALLVPLKVALFFFLLTRFSLRARTALFTAIALANYSEFGLIVGSMGVKDGWLAGEWLTVLAVAVSISMIVASPLGYAASLIYDRLGRWLRKLETDKRLPGDEPLDLGGASAIVFGMGRIGTGAYDQLLLRYGKQVVGIDSDMDRVTRHQEEGRNVKYGDASDVEFWARGLVDTGGTLRLVLLNMSQPANLAAARSMSTLTDGKQVIAASVQYEDEVKPLRKAGVDHVFDIYAEAGAGFSDHVCETLLMQKERF